VFSFVISSQSICKAKDTRQARPIMDLTRVSR
jgi:hypothetical protein